MKNDGELFPYDNHPIRLEVKAKDNSTICYFSCVEHLHSYIERSKVNKKDMKIDYNTKFFSKEQINSMSGNSAPKKPTTRTKKPTPPPTKSKKTSTPTKTKKTTSPVKNNKK